MEKTSHLLPHAATICSQAPASPHSAASHLLGRPHRHQMKKRLPLTCHHNGKLRETIALKPKYTRPVCLHEVSKTLCISCALKTTYLVWRCMKVMSLHRSFEDVYKNFHCPTSCFDLPCHQLGGKWRGLPMHSQRRRLLDAPLLARLLHRPVKSELRVQRKNSVTTLHKCVYIQIQAQKHKRCANKNSHCKYKCTHAHIDNTQRVLAHVT